MVASQRTAEQELPWDRVGWNQPPGRTYGTEQQWQEAIREAADDESCYDSDAVEIALDVVLADDDLAGLLNEANRELRALGRTGQEEAELRPQIHCLLRDAANRLIAKREAQGDD